MNAKVITFAGTWKGFYSYGGPGNIYDFTLTVEVNKEDSLKGTILEANHAEPLEVSGYVHAPVVKFSKLAGNKKSVKYFEPFDYEGFLSSDGLHISGTWTNASAKGDWSAEKSDLFENHDEEDNDQAKQNDGVDINAVMKAPAYEDAPVAANPAISADFSADDGELQPIDAPIESWVPDQAEKDNGLAGSFKTRKQEHSVQSFFSVNPLGADESSVPAAVNEDRGYAGGALAPIPVDEKPANSGAFIGASSANRSAFTVDPDGGEMDLINSIIKRKTVQPDTYNSAPAVPQEPEKLADVGTFINQSVANKSPFSVDPMAGEPDPFSTPTASTEAGTYAADRGDNALDYEKELKDTTDSASLSKGNASAFMIDPIGTDLNLLKDPNFEVSVETPVPVPKAPIGDNAAMAQPAPVSGESSETISPPSVCSRCGAERGGFSFCMSCGHSFDF